MIKEVTGDLRLAAEPTVAHGVNSLGKFGAGVALEIAKTWPYARRSYLRKHRTEGWQPGEVQLVNCHDKTVANICIQAAIGRGGNHADLEAIGEGMTRLYAITNGDIAIPRIGSGLAGGSWDEILAVLTKVTPPDRTLVIYSLPEQPADVS